MMEEYNWEAHNFEVPAKKMKTQADLIAWMDSKAYKEIIGFFTYLQSTVQGKPISATAQNPNFWPYDKFFTNLEANLEECPPIKQPMRFGNRAFKDWHDKLTGTAETLLNEILPANKKGAIPELLPYLLESFGSEVRIDYGTGHELTFAIFLMNLGKLAVLDIGKDGESIVRNIFYKYIALMRKIQTLYFLEPAGSHGVWGLDDYHFLPFL
jgi:serine/threonine-protein phosphatase 2A activator